MTIGCFIQKHHIHRNSTIQSTCLQFVVIDSKIANFEKKIPKVLFYSQSNICANYFLSFFVDNDPDDGKLNEWIMESLLTVIWHHRVIVKEKKERKKNYFLQFVHISNIDVNQLCKGDIGENDNFWHVFRILNFWFSWFKMDYFTILIIGFKMTFPLEMQF